jgi:hypothetical protein
MSAGLEGFERIDAVMHTAGYGQRFAESKILNVNKICSFPIFGSHYNF